MPKVSVIIPTYNRAQFIAEAIRSVLGQSFIDFEIIVIDDGSTDDTTAAVASFPNLRYVRQENRGVSAARNRGVELAKGKYVVFLDSDDVLMERALEIEVETLDKYTNVGFCYGQFYLTDEAGRPSCLRASSLFHSSHIIDGGEQIRELLFTDRIRLSATMMRRYLLSEVGLFDESLKYIAEDLHLFVRMAKRCDVAYISQPLAKIRRHSGCLTNNRDPKNAEKAYLAVLQEVFDDPIIRHRFEPLRNKARFKFYRTIAYYSYGNDMKMSRCYVLKALCVYQCSITTSSGLWLLYMYFKSIIPSWVMSRLKHVRNSMVALITIKASGYVLKKLKPTQPLD